MVKCHVCGADKPASAFYKSSIRKSGCVGECMECTKARVKDNRERKRDYYREYDAKRFQQDPKVRERHHRYRSTDAGRAAMLRSRSKWLADNPDKRSAHVALGNAVRDGRVEKSTTCDRCGVYGRLEGHHHDYSKPLDVTWLCRSCHVAVHREMEDA